MGIHTKEARERRLERQIEQEKIRVTNAQSNEKQRQELAAKRQELADLRSERRRASGPSFIGKVTAGVKKAQATQKKRTPAKAVAKAKPRVATARKPTATKKRKKKSTDIFDFFG